MFLSAYAITINELGVFLGGVAAFLTILFGIVTFIFSKITFKQTDKLMKATKLSYQKIITKQLLKDVENLDPSKFYTIDFRFPNEKFLHVPLIPSKSVTVLENINMILFMQTKESTVVILRCKGFGNLPEHCHDNSDKEIKIVEGSMTCIKTGRTYIKDDIWDVPAKEFHGAHLHNCIAIVTFRPPLLNASERPVNMDDVDQIFIDD